MRSTISLIVLLVFAAESQAEYKEIAVGVHGGLSLPALETDTVSTATWLIGLDASYGVHEDMFLTLSCSFQAFSGKSKGYQISDGSLDYVGVLESDALLIHPELSLRYLLVGGYDLAPYLEFKVGVAFSSFADNDLRNQQSGESFGLQITDFQEISMTLGTAISVDYRIAEMVFLGVGIEFNWYAQGDLFLWNVTMPVKVSYYW